MKKAIMKRNGEATRICFFFLLEPCFLYKCSHAFLLLLNEKCAWNVFKTCTVCYWDFTYYFHLFVHPCLCYRKGITPAFQKLHHTEFPTFLQVQKPLKFYLHFWNTMVKSTPLQAFEGPTNKEKGIHLRSKTMGLFRDRKIGEFNHIFAVICYKK